MSSACVEKPMPRNKNHNWLQAFCKILAVDETHAVLEWHAVVHNSGVGSPHRGLVSLIEVQPGVCCPWRLCCYSMWLNPCCQQNPTEWRWTLMCVSYARSMQRYNGSPYGGAVMRLST